MVAYFHLTRFDNQGNIPSPILQGANFQVIFNYFGDVSNYIPKGQIRTDYAFNDGELLAEFGFEPLTYQLITTNNTEEMATIIVAKLSEADTLAIPIPTLRNSIQDKLFIGTNVYVYDIELRSPSGEVIRLVQGFVEVLPEVTTI
jgi:hypothetical protein